MQKSKRQALQLSHIFGNIGSPSCCYVGTSELTSGCVYLVASGFGDTKQSRLEFSLTILEIRRLCKKKYEMFTLHEHLG